MDLLLHQSNLLENLFAGLCEILAVPPSDPLAPELIVVQNPGMARWLSQRIAVETGIAANLSFPLPASFIWDIFAATLGELPDLAAFDRRVLLWRVLAELDNIGTDPAWKELTLYLRDDRDGRRKYQLAGKISEVFDQYLVYRPDMLLSWEQGRENHWQARLWRRLNADSPMHRAGLLQRFLEAAEAGSLQGDSLPERVSLFGINSLAPAYLEVIARISPFTEIHLFQLSPCRQAWDDITSERLLAVKRQSWRGNGLEDLSGYFSSGNPLLASMGMVGREFFSQLLQYSPRENDLYGKPKSTSMLGAIQADILDLDNRAEHPSPFDPTDTSIRFHCCHSPMREIQVLHDRLLDAFAADPDLKPADILVMAPDIGNYAPAVAGVFGSARGELRIPWSIADRSGAEGQPVIEGFLALLELISSRFTAAEVIALLENPAVLRSLELTGSDFALLRSHIVDAGIRWGLDRQQRRETGRDDSAVHTWEFGLERLLLGYVTGPLEEPLLGILPAQGPATDYAPWLGSLAAFVRNLQELHRLLQQPCSPEEWQERLLRAADTFFTEEAPDQESLLLLRETINDLGHDCTTAGFSGPLDLLVVRRYLARQLTEPAGGQAFLAGKVTFCNMVPMRSVPFKIIWLLGMNDTDYPRTQKPLAFDLVNKQPRLGDRSRRDDDRYLFLEALLSARKELSISWVGRDQQENTELPPSVVVAELADYIDRGWTAEGDKQTSELLTVLYPLQPFSSRCFDGSPQTASYADAWLPTTRQRTAPCFSTAPLPEPELKQLDFARLVRFWNHPVRFFLEQRVGLRLKVDDELLPESEPFAMEHLQQYLLAEDIMARLRNGETPDPLLLREEAAAKLPRGEIGHLLFQDISTTAAYLVQQLRPLTTVPVQPVAIDVVAAGCRLSGRLDLLYSAGRVSSRPATLKAKDLLGLWLHHLMLCLLRPEGVAPLSIHAATDSMVCFPLVDDPQAELEPFVHYFRLGQCRPLHFYPKTSHAWAAAAKDGARMSAAKRCWRSGFLKGEDDDPAYTLALQGQDPLDEEFEALAALFHPIVQRLEQYNAAA